MITKTKYFQVLLSRTCVSFSEVPYADHALKRGSTRTECCIGLSAVPQRRRGSTGGPYDGWSNNALVVRDRIKALETLCFKHPPEHYNGVSSRGLFDTEFTHIIPPYLHLALGLLPLLALPGLEVHQTEAWATSPTAMAADHKSSFFISAGRLVVTGRMT